MQIYKNYKMNSSFAKSCNFLEELHRILAMKIFNLIIDKKDKKANLNLPILCNFYIVNTDAEKALIKEMINSIKSNSLVSLDEFINYFDKCFPKLDLEIISKILDLYLPIPTAECILKLTDKLVKILGKDKSMFRKL